MTRWFAHYIGGQKWAIYLVSPNSKHLKQDGCKLQGGCDYERCRIYINRDLAEGALQDTTLHELVHAWLWVSGAGKAYENDYEKDEDLVGALTPIMHRSLLEFGFRLPPR